MRHGRRYFRGVADARFVIRRVFRVVDECARERGLEPLTHQALIQIVGARGELRVGALAERLDIPPAFASKIVKSLVAAGLATSTPLPHDLRAVDLGATPAGIALLAEIDLRVQRAVGAFNAGLTDQQRESALAIFGFYVGADQRSAKRVATTSS